MWLRLLVVFLLMVPAGRLLASHIVGTDLFYTHIAGNTYKITLILYADCGPDSYGAFTTLPSATPNICVYDGNTSITTLVMGTPVPSAGIEITPVCPDSLPRTQCVSMTNSIPGIKKFTYTTTYTLPYASAVWRFVFNGRYGATYTGIDAARANVITNIVTPGTTGIYLIDTLNNLTAPNSSPQMTVIPTPYFCLNQPNGYNPGVIDADGDGLIFSLVHAVNGTAMCSPLGSNVTYTGTAWPGQPVGPSTPLRCVAGSFIFDPLTGQISFLPDFVQRAAVVYNIREFRGGVLVGTCQREMTFLVRPCVNLPPAGIYDSATAGIITDSTHFEICSGMGAFSIFINPHDPEGQGITMTAAGLPPGATFTTAGSGTASPHGTFSWTTTGVAPGTYVFYITFRDNNCALLGEHTRAFTVAITPPPPPITGTFTLCVGATTLLSNTAAGTWTCSPSSVATISGAGLVTGTGPGTATVSYHMAAGCITTAVVTVDPVSGGAITGAMNVCVGAASALTHPVPGGTWSITGTAATISAAGIVTGVSAGTAIVTYSATTICGISSATVVVTVIAPPVAGAIAGPSEVCVSSFISLSCSPAGGVWSTGSSHVTVSSTGTVTGVSVGTATITYTLTNMCGTHFATKVVTVNPLPGITTITGPGSLCVGTTITLSSSPTGGSWVSITPTVATVAPDGSVTGIAGGTATISYTYTTSCGSLLATKVVTVVPLPVVAPITGPAVLCVGATITLNCLTPGGVWSAAGTATVSATGVVTGVSGGTATISYAVSDTCGTTVVTKTVTVNTLPAPGVISGPTSVCVGAAISLSASVPGGTWSGGGPAASVSATGVVTGLVAGTALISYTVTNTCGPAVATYVVTVNPIPSPGSIGGPSVVCAGNTITLTNSVAGGVWSSTSGNVTVSSTGVVTGVAAGTAVITYAVTALGCTASATYTVTVNDLPAPAALSGGPTVCTMDNIPMTASVPGGVWACTPGAAITSSGILTGLALGTVTVSYTLTNLCGSVTSTRVVTVNLTPDPGVLSGPPTVCVGSFITLSSTAPGGTWASSAPAIAAISPAGVVTGAAAGTANITYAVGTAFCNAATIKVVTVYPLADPGIIMGEPGVCVGDTIVLTSSVAGGIWSCGDPSVHVSATGVVTGISNGGAVVSYTVTNICGPVTATRLISVFALPDPGTITGPHLVCVGQSITLSNAAATGPGGWSSGNIAVATIDVLGQLTAIAPGTALITYATTNGSGCTASVNHVVTVAPLPDAGAISGLHQVCTGAVLTFTQSVSGGIWSSSNPAIVDIDPATGEVRALKAGNVTITYTTAPNSWGCVNQAVFLMAVPAQSPFSVEGQVTHVRCYGDADGSIAVNASAGTGPWQYLWADGSLTALVSGLAAGKYEIDVTEVPTACRAHRAFVITEPDSLHLQPEVKHNMCFMGNGTIELTVSGGTAPYGYLWNTGSTATGLGGLDKGAYTVEVTDKNLCRQARVIDVIDGGCEDIDIQTGLSPNEDGNNDYWVIRGLHNFPRNLVQLYDKWGDLVYEKHGYDNRWDGRDRSGRQLPDGTYFYVIKLNAPDSAADQDVFTGSILVKR